MSSPLIITITAEDEKSTHIVGEPGWFGFVTDEIKVEAAKRKEGKDPSNNFVVYCTGLGPGEMAGVKIRIFYNEQVMGKMIPYLKAIGAVVPGEVNIEAAKGRKFLGYTKIGVNDRGTKFNNIEDFRPFPG